MTKLRLIKNYYSKRYMSKESKRKCSRKKFLRFRKETKVLDFYLHVITLAFPTNRKIEKGKWWKHYISVTLAAENPGRQHYNLAICEIKTLSANGKCARYSWVSVGILKINQQWPKNLTNRSWPRPELENILNFFGKMLDRDITSVTSVLIGTDRYSEWPVVWIHKLTEIKEFIHFLKFFNLYEVPKN